jgi:hypothetical protein
MALLRAAAALARPKRALKAIEHNSIQTDHTVIGVQFRRLKKDCPMEKEHGIGSNESDKQLRWFLVQIIYV